METSCGRCGVEIEDVEVQLCPVCGMDGLCPDCYWDHGCDQEAIEEAEEEAAEGDVTQTRFVE